MSEDEEREREYRRQKQNAPIMPQTPLGKTEEEIGLFKYIEFDRNSNEIRMVIPLSKLLSPEENKRLREEI